MEESKGEECEGKVNEKDQRKSRCVKEVEKRVEASAQVELDRKWISWHMLVTFEVLGQGFRVESQKGGIFDAHII